jgi:hypothetical protein
MTNNTNTESIPMTDQEVDQMHALAFHIARSKILGHSVHADTEARFIALSNRFLFIPDSE